MKRYRSKVDPRIVGGLWMAVLLVLAASSAFALAYQPIPVKWAVGSVGAAIAAALVWIIFGTDYRITACDLVIRAGPFRWQVPLDRIVAVNPTREPVFAPALSLERLRVEQENGSAIILISPMDDEAFLQELAAAAPQLKPVDGSRLQRRTSL